MTDQQHPITPPPELVRQWINDAIGPNYEQDIATAAVQWGADQELEACAKWLAWESPTMAEWVNRLRAARRPKSPSLKEQALEKLMNLEQGTNPPSFNDYNTIRRALEALPE